MNIPFWLFNLVLKYRLQYDDTVKRVSAHGIHSGAECKAMHDQIMQTAKELNVNMPQMALLGDNLK